MLETRLLVSRLVINSANICLMSVPLCISSSKSRAVMLAERKKNYNKFLLCAYLNRFIYLQLFLFKKSYLLCICFNALLKTG